MNQSVFGVTQDFFNNPRSRWLISHVGRFESFLEYELNLLKDRRRPGESDWREVETCEDEAQQNGW